MIENLRKILKQEDTVLFIGSGVSVWSGLPTWSALIGELVEFINSKGLDSKIVEQELTSGELLQAASYGFDKLTKQQVAEFVRKSCRLGTAKPHEIHKKIITLGPKCFITTNYDKLLELSFQKWIPDTHFRTVINRQLTETAEIVGSRATNFLFKLHGDAEDSDSIILTREQYRSLNPGGELYHALETAKTLMVSRPIVYIGFGLRDPDFHYVKDLLLNTYKGGTRDHYAIMADIGEQEKDYWRRNFGIHLISYNTISKSDGKKDHSPILAILDEVAYQTKEEANPTIIINAEFILSIARHASKYLSFENAKSHIPLIVHPIEKRKQKKWDFNMHRYYGQSIENLLDEGPAKLILIGLPGSGKSYALKGSTARFAKELNKHCIDDTFQASSTIIPIFTDLKLYKGNIYELLEQNLPIGMSLSSLLANFKVKIFLDAFNEIPREYLESNQWDSDFSKFLEKTTQSSIILSSRTSDGLEKLELPIFNLDSIEKEFIETRLAQTQLELKGIFKDEILTILQKPFFYKLCFETDFKIESETRPQKIYLNLLSLINSKFQVRFQTKLNLELSLSTAAMDAIDSGEEAFKLDKLSNYISLDLSQYNIESFNASDVINWLVSQEFLIPIVNERICFFHQSITEYLAASKLAGIYEKHPEVLREKLSYKRWDQALFLTLSLLDNEKAEQFLESIINIDFNLALSAIRYMEGDTKEVIARLLLEMGNRATSNQELIFDIAHSLEHKLPVTRYHISILKNIIAIGNSLGGAAALRVIEIMGEDFKEDAFELLVMKCNDFNFCQDLGKALKEMVTINDLQRLLEITNKVQKAVSSKEVKEYTGFDTALGVMMQGFDPMVVYETFFKPNISKEDQKVHIAVLLEFLGDCQTNEGLIAASNLLVAGIADATVEIYFITEFTKDKVKLDYSMFNHEHLKSLIKVLKSKNSENAEWALGAIKNICSKREDFIPYILENAERGNGILKAALLYVVAKNNDYAQVFETFEKISEMDNKKLLKEPFSLISHMDKINWQGQKSLFVKLLKLRNIKLAYNLCDGLALHHDSIPNFILDIGPIKWWLDWFFEFYKSKKKEWMFEDRVSTVIAKYISKDKRKEFIDEFNKSDSPYRKILTRSILREIDDLSIGELSDNSISYLLNDLKTTRIYSWQGSILADVATEPFVTDRLLPLIKSAEGFYLENLKKLVEMIGNKHDRRYMLQNE